MTMDQKTADRTIADFRDSLTGWEEDAIEKYYGYPFGEFPEEHAQKVVRAVVMVTKAREGVAFEAARDLVQGMSRTAVAAFVEEHFGADEPEELDPAAPETPVGKDDSAPRSKPKS